MGPQERISVDDLLCRSRQRIDRLTPRQARDAVRSGAVLVDIRPAAQRESEGDIPEALVVERNVLEWRFDPSSEACLPVANYDRQVVLICQDGYASSLAAATLQDLGLYRATDVIGGQTAWRQSSCTLSPAGAEPVHP